MWIKLCGLTREEDVRLAVRAGADAVGLVLAAESPRRVGVDRAARLAAAAREEPRPQGCAPVQVVGVFTQSDGEWVVRAARSARLDLIQLHGGQPESLRHRLEQAGWPCIRTLWPAAGETPPRWEGSAPWAFLLDSRSGKQAGGTGTPQVADLAAGWQRCLAPSAPVILAGGLGPHNVTFYLEAVGPWGVDASSGLERPGCPGIKDPEAVRAFIEAARRWEMEHARAG